MRVELLLVLRELIEKMPLSVFVKIMEKKLYNGRNEIDSSLNFCKKYIVQLMKLRSVIEYLEVTTIQLFTFDFETYNDEYFSNVDAELFGRELTEISFMIDADDDDLELSYQLQEDAKEKNKKITEKNKDVDLKICDICMSNKKDTLFDCLHLFCRECAKKLDKCALCKKKPAQIFPLQVESE
jgi:hypothetical protein